MTASIETLLAPIGPISLDDANVIAELQTRVDRKYLVDDDTLHRLLAAVAPTVRVLEIDGARSCEYRSTYFDTSELALYRAAVQGRRLRHKVRRRQYGTAGPCFLEVKSKGRRGTNVKARVPCDTSDGDRIGPQGLEFIARVTDGTLGGVVDGGEGALRPALTTQYVRSTIVDLESRTRWTFDRGLRCTDTVGREAGLDAVVIETKSAGTPSAVDRWLWQHQVRPTKLSKYCTGLAAIRPDLPAHRWHRVIDRHWHREEASRRQFSA